MEVTVFWRFLTHGSHKEDLDQVTNQVDFNSTVLNDYSDNDWVLQRSKDYLSENEKIKIEVNWGGWDL